MGDTNMCTDNPVILHNTKNLPTIVCVQRKAKKTVPTEEDIIAANKLAFNDDIGVVTNHVTSMFEVQAGFEKGTKEYETLDYRIMCGQLFQQNTIDRAKGVIAKSMPPSWYSVRENKIKEDDEQETIAIKEFNQKIVADKKPYFMTYVYPSLKKQNREYIKKCDKRAHRNFSQYQIYDVEQLNNYADKNNDMQIFLDNYYKELPTGGNHCIVNRISWLFEDIFNSYFSKNKGETCFDYSILKSGVEYSQQDYKKILNMYNEYLYAAKKSRQDERLIYGESFDEYEFSLKNAIQLLWLKSEYEKICSNKYELCDIVIDICYQKEVSKQFAWDICGETIVENLLNNSQREISYPEQSEIDHEFVYCGRKFIMKTKNIGVDLDDNS